MGKRSLSLVLSLALIGGLFAAALPVYAQEAPPVTIPDVVQVDDPMGDANYLNDQSLLNAIPKTQDNGTPRDAGGTSDLMKVWYSADATTVSVNIQTEAAPPATAASYIYRVFSNPGEGSVAASSLGCLRFFVFMPSGNPPVGGYSGPQHAGLLDYCDKGTSYTTDIAEGDLKITELSDGTGVMTITVPRAYSPKLADGQVLTAPHAQVQNLVGTGTDGNGQPIATDASIAGGNWRRGPQIDNTIIGTDWTITGGDPSLAPGKPAKPTPPGKNDPPGKGKKKGCDKGSGKKKGACPGKKPGKPTPATCPPYVPGEEGTGAATSVVTDAATAEKPVVVELDSEMGLGAMPIGGTPVPYDETTRFYQNIQVDTASADTGLYARLDFAEHRDYDLYLNYPDGSEGDHSGDFSTIANTAFRCGGKSCESGPSHEAILGLRTPDCGGWTAEMVSFLSEGGPVTLSLWLGEVLADPAPKGSDAEAEALSTFYAMTGFVNPSAAAGRASSPRSAQTPAADKGCKKGKGKKTGCKKPPVACSPFKPGKMGAENPTVIVNDGHTAEAPALQPISLGPEFDEGILSATPTPKATFNVQVDSASPTAGLYVTFEFQTHRDYDMWAYFADGGEAASSHGFQPLIDTKGLPGNADQSNTASNHGGESTATSENFIGIITPDCGGYTIQASTYFGEGGDFDVKLWLGEGVTEPGVPS